MNRDPDLAQNRKLGLRTNEQGRRNIFDATIFKYRYYFQCFGSVTLWYGSGSLDPCTWLRIRNRILILLFLAVVFKMPTKYFFFLWLFCLFGSVSSVHKNKDKKIIASEWGSCNRNTQILVPRTLPCIPYVDQSLCVQQSGLEFHLNRIMS